MNGGSDILRVNGLSKAIRPLVFVSQFANMTSTILHPIEASAIHARRERAYLLLAGLFIGSMAMLNVLGISRFIVLFSLSPGDGGYELTWGQWGEISFALAVGVLPYPLTFLCTDIISEFYGRRRANWLVFVGFIVNIWVIFIMWVGGLMPPVPTMDPATGLPAVENIPAVVDADGNTTRQLDGESFAFYRVRALAFGAVAASMIAYLAAQFCDVYLFHFWKKLTGGKHLWLRNNGSTLISQLVDTTSVILITYFYAKALPEPKAGISLAAHLGLFIATGYVFKLVVALLDTIPFYLSVRFLRRYLQFDSITENQS